MLYMLDTDISSYIIRQRPLAVLQMLQQKAGQKDELVISSITYAELRLGAQRSSVASKQHALIDGFCHRLSNVLPWDAQAADAFAKLQAELLTSGAIIGTNDAMMAGHALSVEATLVTNNQRHFSRVSGLKLENWAMGL